MTVSERRRRQATLVSAVRTQGLVLRLFWGMEKELHPWMSLLGIRTSEHDAAASARSSHDCKQ